MLKREFKLKNSEEIKNILRLGRKIRGNSLTLFVSAGAQTHCRAAIVVSKKVATAAVIRNRVRRVLFSDLEKRFASWENRPISASDQASAPELSRQSRDMVVMVMNIPEDESQLKIDLEQCFARW